METSTPAKSTSRRRLKGYVHRHLFGILAVGVNLTYTLIPGQATDGKHHHRTKWENLCKGQKLAHDFKMNPDSLNCTNERFFESEALFNYHGVDNLAEANEKKCVHRLARLQNNSSEKRKLQTHFIFFVRATFEKQSLSDALLPLLQTSGEEAKCQISIQFIVSFQLFRHQ